MTQAATGSDADFTEIGYRAVLALARERFTFAFFGEAPAEPHVLWRHDVDMSVHRAVALAAIEADAKQAREYFETHG